MVVDEDASNYQYCAQKLKHVNPTDAEDLEDTKDKIVTARGRLYDENTKVKLLRDDIMLDIAKPLT